MPAVGDQHNNAPMNPFEDQKLKVSEYTALQIATLQSRLQKQLGPEYISTRKGPGGKNVHYIASEKVIGLANEVFGFNGWSSTIRDIQVDFVDENVQTHKVDIGLSVVVRVSLRDGTYHEDIGYGHIENCSGKAAAFEKAKKEGTTDALKRALRNFGNVLGNCVYDKEYLGKVTKLKVKPIRFEEGNLHRHPAYAQNSGHAAQQAAAQPEPPKQAPNPAVAGVQAMEANGIQPASRRNSIHTETEDEFGSADFDVADFSFADLDNQDEMSLDHPQLPVPETRPNPPQRNHHQTPPRPAAQAVSTRPQSLPSQHIDAPRPPNEAANVQTNSRLASNHPPQNRPSAVSGPGPQSGLVRPGQPQGAQIGTRPGNHQMQPPRQAPQQQQQPPTVHQQQSTTQTFEQPIPAGAPAGFVSARAAEPVQNGSNAPAQLPQFNPRAESPSIRKTAGVDHSKSTGIKRTNVPGPEVAGSGRTAQPEIGRRLGAPQNMPSPLANRGQFKPVGIVAKRPADGPLQQQQNRAALNDVTPMSINAPGAIAQIPDSKRPRLQLDQNHISGVNNT